MSGYDGTDASEDKDANKKKVTRVSVLFVITGFFPG